MATTGRVLSINVGQVCEFAYNDRPVKGAIWTYSFRLLFSSFLSSF
jgi:hypothetical protein